MHVNDSKLQLIVQIWQSGTTMKYLVMNPGLDSLWVPLSL